MFLEWLRMFDQIQLCLCVLTFHRNYGVCIEHKGSHFPVVSSSILGSVLCSHFSPLRAQYPWGQRTGFPVFTIIEQFQVQAYHYGQTAFVAIFFTAAALTLLLVANAWFVAYNLQVRTGVSSV